MIFGVNETTKLHDLVGQVQFVVWKFNKFLLHQIAREIMLLFVDKAHEKTSQKVKKDVHAKCTCNLHLCYNFALLLHENALIFSQSEGCNFFMFIIKF